MVKELIHYPDERINIASADVRKFDEELGELVQDIKDTIEANNADGLAAIQIAVPLSIVVAKDPEGSWHEFFNPRILRVSGKTTSVETSLYLPDIEEEIPRHEKITFIYQDRTGKQHSMSAEGEFGFLLQRKFDYTFGGTFANKLDRKNRKRVEKKLSIQGSSGEFNANSTISKREYFKSVINKLLFFEALTFFGPLFGAKKETLQSFYHYGIFATITSLILIVSYLIYAKYEADKMVSCTGCQVVSFTAVAVKYFLVTILLFAGSYFWVNPN
ncbi:MAG: peptide deformylase [Campylobacterota bacterium]|nr:peptide deformylase [Campylobacterota bacterium]